MFCQREEDGRVNLRYKDRANSTSQIEVKNLVTICTYKTIIEDNEIISDDSMSQ